MCTTTNDRSESFVTGHVSKCVRVWVGGQTYGSMAQGEPSGSLCL